jgi:predicted DCC family thiol-disulfide oxidoreductase YuxK
VAKKILFFDGICVMCNRLIRFVLHHDKKREVQFATLQGETAKRLLSESHRNNLTTIVFLDEKGIHTESDAMLRLFSGIGGVFSLATVLTIFPKSFRDRVYRYVAQNRYRWFGKTESCALLSEDDRERILD